MTAVGAAVRAALSVTLGVPVRVEAAKTGVRVGLLNVMLTPSVIALMTVPVSMPVPVTGMPTKRFAVEPV